MQDLGLWPCQMAGDLLRGGRGCGGAGRMIRFAIKKRDGLARAGLMTGEGLPGSPVPFPAVFDTAELFPTLDSRAGTNVPLSAPPAFAAAYVPTGTGQPVTIHPALENPAAGGDVVMAANWHTALANPRQYV